MESFERESINRLGWGAKDMSALVGSGTKLKREEDVCPCTHRKCY